MMKVLAHLSPTVLAVLAAALGITLSVFLLSGAGAQGEPAPLLAVISGAAGRVAADLPAAVHTPASKPIAEAASYTPPAITPSVRLAPTRQAAATQVRRGHGSARSGAVRRAPFAHSQGRPATPATPVTTHGHGHGHAHALKSFAGAHVSGAHGHGKASGHSSEHHHGHARGHAKKATPPSVPATPPKEHGGGHGHKEGKK
jgi:hypothetical protein